MSGAAEVKHHCEGCDCAAECKHTFGDFWIYKSHGGKGCANKIEIAEWREATRQKMSAGSPSDERADRAMATPEWKRKAAASAKTTPTFHKWIVTHLGVDYATAAATPAQAMNFVRFKKYGDKPFFVLPAFTCRAADDGLPRRLGGVATAVSLSKAEAMKRLHRMT